MQFTKEEWMSIYSEQTKKMIKKFDTNVIAKKIEGKFGCVVNVNGTNYGKDKIVIRAYCGHKYESDNLVETCRKYKLQLQYESLNYCDDRIFLEFFYENVSICHKERKTRELRGVERNKIQEKLKIVRPEVLQRQIGTEIDIEVLEKTKNYQEYKSTAVYQKASEERRRREDNDKEVIMDIFLEINNQKKDKKTQYLRSLNFSPFAVYSFCKLQAKILKKVT